MICILDLLVELNNPRSSCLLVMILMIYMYMLLFPLEAILACSENKNSF